MQASTMNCVLNIPPAIDCGGESVRSVLEVQFGRLRVVTSNRGRCFANSRIRNAASGFPDPEATASSQLPRLSLIGDLASPAVVVHVKWWGDSQGEGHFISPSNRSPADRKLRYAIRCGHRQLEAYLNDMQSLPIRIYSSTQLDRRLLGIAYVDNLQRIVSSKCISGTYPVIVAGGKDLVATLSVVIRLSDLPMMLDDLSKNNSAQSKITKSPIASKKLAPILSTPQRPTATTPLVSSGRQQSPRATPSSKQGLKATRSHSNEALRQTLSSLIDRVRGLRSDVTKHLLDDADRRRVATQRSVSAENHQNSVSEAMLNYMEAGIVDETGCSNDLVRNMEAALDPRSAALSSSSDTDHSSDDQLYLQLHDLPVNKQDSHLDRQPTTIKDGRSFKRNARQLNTRISSKQVSFQRTIPVAKGSSRLPVNEGARKFLANRSVLPNNRPSFDKNADIHKTANVFCLLSIPEGKSFANVLPGSDFGILQDRFHRRRLYLSCRAFWSDSVAKSSHCWPSSDNETYVFGFRHEAATVFTEFVLERRIKGNVMVVEVWSPSASEERNERLLGTCKVPLMGIYETFNSRQKVIAPDKLWADVVVVDDFLPVSELLTGQIVGQLRVLLVVGTDRKRVVHRLGVTSTSTTTISKVPIKIPMPVAAEKIAGGGRHVFEVIVKCVMMTRPPIGDQVWGESNCRVDYSFLGLRTPCPPSVDGDADSSRSMSMVQSKRCTVALNWILSEPLMNWNSALEHQIEVAPRESESGDHQPDGLLFRVTSMHYYPVELVKNLFEVKIAPSELRHLMMESGQAKIYTLPLKENSDLQQEDRRASSIIGLLTVQLCHLYCAKSEVRSTSVGTTRHNDPTWNKNNKSTNTSFVYRRDLNGDNGTADVVDTISTKELSTNFEVPVMDKCTNIVAFKVENVNPNGRADDNASPAAVEECKASDRTFSTGESTRRSYLNVAIERAVHLHVYTEDEPHLANAYVTLDSRTKSNKFRTDVIRQTDSPVWDAKFCSVPWDNDHDGHRVLGESTNCFLVFNVYHQRRAKNCTNHNSERGRMDGSRDHLIGLAAVDLSPLKCGLPFLCGWYNIVDAEARCNGQLKVDVQPSTSIAAKSDQEDVLTMHRRSRHSSDDAGNGQNGFVTCGHYEHYPSHIGQFVEQTICCQPKISTEDIETGSRSFLVNNLWLKLEELDERLRVVGRPQRESSAEREQILTSKSNSKESTIPQYKGSELNSPKPKGTKTKNPRRRIAAAIYNQDPDPAR